MTLPRVALVATGGTIAALGAGRLDLSAYLETGRWLGEGELLAGIPEVDAIADVREIPFRRLPGHAIGDADLADLHALVERLLGPEAFDGVVITHGTNTIEETAYFLHLTLGADAPIVIAGAMRPASGISGDGPLNLLNAIRVAAHPAARGIGTLVVLDDTIHGARDVSKTATSAVSTFRDRELGPLGFIDADGRVSIRHRPARARPLATVPGPDAMRSLPRVDIVTSYQGADGALVDAAVAAGAMGIVSAGTGAGFPTPAEVAALERASATGTIVCQGSRVGEGRVVRTPAMTGRGWVAADNLPAWKARILLRLGLATVGADVDELQRLFDIY